MPVPVLSEALAIETYNAVKKYMSLRGAANRLGIPESTLKERYYNGLKRGLFEPIERLEWTYPTQVDVEVKRGSVLIGSDAHTWPGQKPFIYEVFLEVAATLKPKVIILNGDMFDGTRISRFGHLRGQNAPKVSEELETSKAQVDRIPGTPKKIMTIGNHCTMRVDQYFANAASEADDICPKAEDWFPDWRMCYAAMINGHVEVRHRFRSGIHARHNNTVNSGISMVTGHTHQLGVTPFDDRNGRRYGIECGMLNDPMAPQFEYTEGQPTRWCAGFAVLTFDEEGRLLPPELCEMTNGRAWFRGASWGVGKPKIYGGMFV